MGFENFWRRDRDRQGEERNRGSGTDWRGREQDRYGRRDFGGMGRDDDQDFNRRGWREGSDYYGNRDRTHGWRGSESYGSQRGYGGQDYRRDYGGSDWRDEGMSYGGEFSAGSYTQGQFGLDRDDDASSMGGGGYGRDLDYGRRGALGYGGYGGMGGAETGSSAYGYLGSQQQGQPHRGRGPRGYRRSDERIREDVCDMLAEDPYIDASNMEVTVKDCEVTLSGTVSSRADKRRAEDLVERISGVKDVHNMLRVAGDPRAQNERGSDQQSPSEGAQAPRH